MCWRAATRLTHRLFKAAGSAPFNRLSPTETMAGHDSQPVMTQTNGTTAPVPLQRPGAVVHLNASKFLGPDGIDTARVIGWYLQNGGVPT